MALKPTGVLMRGVVHNELGTDSKHAISQKIVTDELNKKVPTARKINGKALTADVTLAAGEVGAYTKAEVDGKVSVLVPKTAVTQVTGNSTTNIMSQKVVTDQLATKVPTSRTINGKPLSANISLTAADIGALPSGSNAVSATKLATPRNINGTAFDGSANITTANWGTSRTFTLGSSSKAVNGSGNVSFSLTEMGAVSNTDTRLSDSREWIADTMSQAEAEAGTATTRRAVTSLVLRQAVSAYALSKAESNTQAALKVDKTSVVQTTGTSTTNIMSQKAVTDAINASAGSVPTNARSVGTYVLARAVGGRNNIFSYGDTASASRIECATDAGGNKNGGNITSGTWRCMGAANGDYNENKDRTTLWVRIS